MSRLARGAAVATAAFALVPLAAHAYLGTFSRYLADDFCTASTLRRLGFAGSQSYWYTSWSGRFSSTLIVSLAEAVGPRLIPWLTSLLLVIWVAAGATFGGRFLARPWGWVGGIALAAVHAWAVLQGAPSIYQSVYWLTGMITYTLPLALSVAYGAWLWQAASGGGRPRSLAAACAVSLAAAFALGGFSETYVSLQTAALALALVLALWRRPTRARGATVVGFGLLGSVLAGVAVAFAPGTQIRSGLMPPHPGALELITASVKDGYLFVARTAKGVPEVIALAVLVPLVLVWLARQAEPDGSATARQSRIGVAAVVLLPIVTPLLMLATIVPYEYAVSSYPDARVLITAMFVLVSGLVLWGLELGRLAAGLRFAGTRFGSAVALTLTAVVAIGLAAAAIRSTSGILAFADVARPYAESWDTRDGKLREAAGGNSDLVAAASLRHMGGLAEIGRDPDEWINRCVAGTYGVGAVVAK